MTQAFVFPNLDADAIERMRAPLDVENEPGLSRDDDTSDEEGNEKKNAISGTFPGGPITHSSTASYY